MKCINRALLSLLLAGGMVHAAETVHWDDIAQVVAQRSRPGGSIEYTIVTARGERIKTRVFTVSSAELLICPDRTLPRDQVAEIQIRHRGRFIYFGQVLGGLCTGDGYDCLFFDGTIALALLPIDLAYGAVATPLMLIVESARRLAPAKILKIVPWVVTSPTVRVMEVGD